MKNLTLATITLLLAIPVETNALAATKAKASAPAPAVTGQGMHIAAVVGDEAISSYDVDNRIKFIIVTAKFSNTPDVIEKIRPQVIRSLVDEKLQLQEAKKNDIKVTDEEVAQAIASIEKDRGMPSGAIESLLQDNNIPKETFTQQIRAQIVWHKLLVKKIKPQVKISDEEIKLGGLKASAPPAKSENGPQEWQIAVIALPVEKPSRENEMRRLGEKLVKEVRGGASFEEVSRQFSSATASAGGKVETFWVKPDQLDPAVAKALVAASAGFVSEPVRTTEGYTIVKVYGTRTLGGGKSDADDEKDMDVTLKEILLKLKPDAETKEAKILLQIGEDVAKHPGSCTEKGVAGLENLDDFDIQVDFLHALLSELPSAVKIIAENLKVGDISTPFASDEGIRLFMLCEKKEAGAHVPDRDQVYNMLMQEKMNLEAQKYMRNLRRDAFVDVR